MTYSRSWELFHFGLDCNSIPCYINEVFFCRYAWYTDYLSTFNGRYFLGWPGYLDRKLKSICRQIYIDTQVNCKNICEKCHIVRMPMRYALHSVLQLILWLSYAISSHRAMRFKEAWVTSSYLSHNCLFHIWLCMLCFVMDLHNTKGGTHTIYLGYPMI